MHFISHRFRFLLSTVVLISIALLPATSPALRRRPAHPRRHRPLPLTSAIPRLLRAPGMEQAHWGISVVSLRGKSLYGYQDTQLFHPASNAKLFTTAAAFALLPAQLTYTTRVVAQSPISPSGEIAGDLVIVGAGDPNISGRALPFKGETERPNPPLAALESMADQIVSHGVHKIDGDIVGDDTWFPYERYPEGWSWGDLQWEYGAPISALTVNDNVVYLNLAPAAQAGQPAVASWLPATSYYTLENDVATVANGNPQTFGIERAPGSLNVRAYGQTPVGSGGIHVALALEDPADFAARSLKEMLVARGVRVVGEAKARHRYNTATGSFLQEQDQPLTLNPVAISTVAPPFAGLVLASHVSPPLSEDLVVTNKVSQNLHAEITLRTLGKLLGSDGSLAEGTRVVRQFLLQAGVAGCDFMLYDGSGLSPMDEVTPRAFTTLLVYAAQQSWGNDFRGTLPIGGVDGTLAGRFDHLPLRGKVFAKSGTLAEASALTGYVIARSGRTVAFSVLCDDHLASTDEIRQTMDKIVAAIAAVE